MVIEKNYAFGNTVFRILSPIPLPCNEQLESFIVPADTPADHTFCAVAADEAALAEMSPDDLYLVRRAGNETTVSMKDVSLLSDFSLSLLLAKARAYDILLERDALVLHASFVARDGKALLFSAPSGTGKSTQAHFWREHRQCEILNEDRVILFKDNGEFYATGCWAMGSAGYTSSTVLPVDTLVLLSRGEENAVSPLRPSELLRRTIPQCAFTSSDPASRGRVIGLLCDLAASVRTVSYACINHPSSVEHLEKVLWKK